MITGKAKPDIALLLHDDPARSTERAGRLSASVDCRFMPRAQPATRTRMPRAIWLLQPDQRALAAPAAVTLRRRVRRTRCDTGRAVRRSAPCAPERSVRIDPSWRFARARLRSAGSDRTARTALR